MTTLLLSSLLAFTQTGKTSHLASAHPESAARGTAARVFMTPDGVQHAAPLTGPTRVAIAAGSTRQIMVWFHNTSGASELINAYQLIFPWFVEPRAGAAGTVEYLDTSGGSLLVDQFNRVDWLFATSLGDLYPVYNETYPILCGVLYSDIPGFGVIADPREIYYLTQLELVASADAAGAFDFALRRAPDSPPWTSVFNPFGAPFQLDNIEYQPVEVVVVTAPVSSAPPDGAIDARQPGPIDGGDPAGWQEIELTFAAAPAAAAEDFELEASGGPVPAIEEVIINGMTATVLLDGPIPAGACTTLRHLPTGWTVQLGSLPGDVNGDGASGPFDILSLIDGLNGIAMLEAWQCDIDRSESCEPADILRLIDLLNGAGAYESWNGTLLPQCP